MKKIIGVIQYRWCVPNIVQLLELQRKFPDILVNVYGNDALVERARSMFATGFMKSDFEAVLFIDSDIRFRQEDILKIFTHLENPKYAIIGGMYPCKSRGNLASSQWEGQTIEYKFDSEPIMIKYLATGFMGVRREVFEKISRKLPLLHKDQWWGFYPFFKSEIQGDKYLSEDWYFCELARKRGFNIWIDPSIKLGHVGEYEHTINSVFGKSENETLKITEAK